MGENRPADPKINDVWVTAAGVLEYYNGADWVPYLSPPETGPGEEFQPGMLEQEPADESDAPDETSGDS